ncbi:MAG: helix-turn-helix domain-containing protein, partial [Nannocystaceae bacterium]
ELAASRGRPRSPTSPELDAGAWLAWATVGLALFEGERLPTAKRVLDEARRMLLALAMERTAGNISAIAKHLDTSRRAVRHHLQRLGLYDVDVAPRVDHERNDGDAAIHAGRSETRLPFGP